MRRAFLKNQDDAIAILKELGLTTVQAKTYIALVKTDVSAIKEIASLSKVPRTDLYRSIQELEKKGLVERILSKPIRFRAIPVDECLNILYGRIIKNHAELKKKTLKLRTSLKNGKNHRSSELNSSEYILVPKSRAIEKIRKAIDVTEATLDVVSSWDRFSGAIFLLTMELKKAWGRGVKCRFAVESPKGVGDSSNGPEKYMKMPFLKIKFMASSPQTIVSIYDRREIIVIENPAASLRESPVLWSNNQSLVSMAADFFEILWITAMENPNFQTDPEPRHDKTPQPLKGHNAFPIM